MAVVLLSARSGLLASSMKSPSLAWDRRVQDLEGEDSWSDDIPYSRVEGGRGGRVRHVDDTSECALYSTGFRVESYCSPVMFRCSGPC